MVEDGKCGEFVPKPSDWIQAILLIMHDNLRIMDHSHFEVGTLQIQIVS
jgi:hypothetical protein